MSEFLHYDPITGTTKLFDWDDSTHSAVIRTEQDVEPFLKHAKESANTGGTDSGIKRDFWHYASLPAVVQLQLKAKGIDIYSQDTAMIRRMFAEINAEFPSCKMTSKMHR